MTFVAKIILLVPLGFGMFGDSAIQVASQTTETDIQTIRRQFAAINKRLPRSKKVRKELSGFSLEGGELVAYLNGQQVIKITATHFGEMGKTQEEYYYQDGRLIFLFQKTSHYNRPLSGRVVRVAEDRFYFKDDQLIRWMEGRKPTEQDLKIREEAILEQSKKFIEGVKSKNRVIEDSE